MCVGGRGVTVSDCHLDDGVVVLDGEGGSSSLVRVEDFIPVVVPHRHLMDLRPFRPLIRCDLLVGCLAIFLGVVDHGEGQDVPIECEHWHHVVRIPIVVEFPCENSLLWEKRLTENDHVEINGFVGCPSIACAGLVHDFAGDGVAAGWENVRVELDRSLEPLRVVCRQLCLHQDSWEGICFWFRAVSLLNLPRFRIWHRKVVFVFVFLVIRNLLLCPYLGFFHCDFWLCVICFVICWFIFGPVSLNVVVYVYSAIWCWFAVMLIYCLRVNVFAVSLVGKAGTRRAGCLTHLWLISLMMLGVYVLVVSSVWSVVRGAVACVRNTVVLWILGLVSLNLLHDVCWLPRSLLCITGLSLCVSTPFPHRMRTSEGHSHPDAHNNFFFCNFRDLLQVWLFLTSFVIFLPLDLSSYVCALCH